MLKMSTFKTKEKSEKLNKKFKKSQIINFQIEKLCTKWEIKLDQLLSSVDLIYHKHGIQIPNPCQKPEWEKRKKLLEN